MKLSTGREVLETINADGVTEAVMADGGEMSHVEWDEYAARVVEDSRKAAQEYEQARKLRNQEAMRRDGLIK